MRAILQRAHCAVEERRRGRDRSVAWPCYVLLSTSHYRDHCMSVKETSEKHFLQGFSSAQGGLAAETCPYEYVPVDQEANIERVTAPANWKQGWQFGRFVAIQRLRREKSEEIRNAIQAIFLHEAAYSEMQRTVNQGLLKAGLRYFTARRGSNQLARQIQQSKEFRLLQDLHIELYLPWRPSEQPYFKLFDRQLQVFGFRSEEETLRQLLARYGDRHGVRAAWHEYVHAEPIETMVPASALSRSQH